MPVYIKQLSSTRRIMYTPVSYTRGAPVLPLWQAHVFDSSGIGSLAAGVWIWMGCYCTHFEDTAADETVFNNSKNGTGDDAWNEVGTGWNASASTRGTDDGETAGVTSHQYAYTGTVNDYAELTFTVPSDWAGASLDTQWYATTISCGTITATKDGQAFAINGRGSDYGASIVHRRIPRWNSSDRIQSDNVSDNFTAEILRNLQPGSYTLRITMNGDSTRMAVGRARLRKRDSAYLDLTSATVREYFPEYDTSLGPYMTDDSTTSYIIAIDEGGTKAGGPGHGNEAQTGATWQKRIGSSVSGVGTMSDGEVLGPYDDVRLTTEGSLTITTLLCSYDSQFVLSNKLDVFLAMTFNRPATIAVGYISMMTANNTAISYDSKNAYDFSDIDYPGIKEFSADVVSDQTGDETVRRVFKYGNLPQSAERNIGRNLVFDAALNQASFENTALKIYYETSSPDNKSYYTVIQSEAVSTSQVWNLQWSLSVEEANPRAARFLLGIA